MIYRAIVVDDKDPENLHRVRVRCAQIYGIQVSGWAEGCVPGDSAAVPTIGTPVWIALEAGDSAKPVWLGRWLKGTAR